MTNNSTIETTQNSPIPQDNPVSEPINMPPSEPISVPTTETPAEPVVVSEPIPEVVVPKPVPEVIKPEPVGIPEPVSAPEVSADAISSGETKEAPATEVVKEVKEPAQTIHEYLMTMLIKANEARKSKKKNRLNIIMGMFEENNPIRGNLSQGDQSTLSERQRTTSNGIKITNKDVEKLLKFSDSAAGRYLSILVKEGKIVRHGKNKGTFYTLK